MALITVVGPLLSKQEAEETASYLGNQHSVFYRTDDDGIESYFVERDDSIVSGQIFGYESSAFLRRQYK